MQSVVSSAPVIPHRARVRATELPMNFHEAASSTVHLRRRSLKNTGEMAAIHCGCSCELHGPPITDSFFYPGSRSLAGFLWNRGCNLELEKLIWDLGLLEGINRN